MERRTIRGAEAIFEAAIPPMCEDCGMEPAATVLDAEVLEPETPHEPSPFNRMPHPKHGLHVCLGCQLDHATGVHNMFSRED